VRSRGGIRLILCFLAGSIAAFAGTNFKPTTTLTAETSNNTSAAGTFATQTNGNIGAGNISKVPTRTLLYPGSTAKIFVHTMPWFGFGDHMDVGYASNDPAQAQRQINDMVSRGIDGAIIDWFGQGKLTHKFVSYDQAVQDLMAAAQAHTNFHFAIMDDAQSLQACSNTAGCDVTQTLIDDLTYVYNTYGSSSAYLYYNNRPVVYFFGQEFYTIDWTRVRASAPGNPLFIFRNTEGFSDAENNGAFAWVEPELVTTSDPMALKYMGQFDQQALSLLPTYSNAAAYKGFDDSLASWGSNRLIQQQCGQTWLQSVAESAKYFSATQQMIGIQFVTWNDYEEGTEIESGIDNCVTVNASATGSVVSWSITGQSSTVDHSTVFLSQDGENLMWLADLPVTTTSLDLAPFGFDPGNYSVFVEAIGKPSLTNKMSAAVAVTIANKPPVAVLTLTPASGAVPLTVNASTAGSIDPDGSIASITINFGDGSATVNTASASHVYSNTGSYTVTATVTDNLGAKTTNTAIVSVTAQPTFDFASGSNNSATVQAGQSTTYNLVLETKGSGFSGVVSLGCSGAPAGVTCTVNPGSANFVGGSSSVSISVTAATTLQARSESPNFRGMEFAFAAVFGGLLCGFKKRNRLALFAALAIFLVCGVVACGGGGGSSVTGQPPAPHSPTTATLIVTGSSGTQSATTNLTLTIMH